MKVADCRWKPKNSAELQEGFRCLDEYIQFLNDSIKICGYDPEQSVGIGHKLGKFEINPLDGLPEKIFGLSGNYPLEIHIHEGEEHRIKYGIFDLSLSYAIRKEGTSSGYQVAIVGLADGALTSSYVDSPLLTGKFPDDLAKIRDCCMEIKNALGKVCSPYASSMVY